MNNLFNEPSVSDEILIMTILGSVSWKINDFQDNNVESIKNDYRMHIKENS